MLPQVLCFGSVTRNRIVATVRVICHYLIPVIQRGEWTPRELRQSFVSLLSDANVGGDSGRAVLPGGRYWDRTSDLSGVNRALCQLS